MTGNLTLTALRDSGFQDALEARRMAILAAIETPDHEDNHDLLEELKQITVSQVKLLSTRPPPSRLADLALVLAVLSPSTQWRTRCSRPKTSLR